MLVNTLRSQARASALQGTRFLSSASRISPRISHRAPWPCADISRKLSIVHPRQQLQESGNVYLDEDEDFVFEDEENPVRGGTLRPADSMSQEIRATRTLFVSNLPYWAQRADVERMFEQFGKIIAVEHRQDGDGYCSAHISYYEVRSAMDAMAAHYDCHLRMGNRRLTVQYSLQKLSVPNPPSPTIFIGKLKDFVTEAEIHEMLKDYGPIYGLRLAQAEREDGTTFGRGFAHVDFPSIEAAQAVIDAHQSKPFRLHHRDVQMNFSSPTSTLPSSALATALDPVKKLAPKGPVSSTLYVAGLKEGISSTHVEAFFGRWGKIVDIRFAKDDSGRSRDFCYIDFESKAAVQEIVEEHKEWPLVLLGRPLKLDYAQPAAKNPPHHTLFVRGEFESEARLRSYFIQYEDFIQLITFHRSPLTKTDQVAFIQFDTIEHARSARRALDGYRTPSGNQLWVQYASSPTRKRRAEWELEQGRRGEMKRAAAQARKKKKTYGIDWGARQRQKPNAAEAWRDRWE